MEAMAKPKSSITVDAVYEEQYGVGHKAGLGTLFRHMQAENEAHPYSVLTHIGCTNAFGSATKESMTAAHDLCAPGLSTHAHTWLG